MSASTGAPALYFKVKGCHRYSAAANISKRAFFPLFHVVNLNDALLAQKQGIVRQQGPREANAGGGLVTPGHDTGKPATAR